MNHPVAEEFQSGSFEHEVYPRHSYQDRKEQNACTGIESKNVGDGHQRKTVCTETLTHILGNLASQLFLYGMEEFLEMGSLGFLALGIPYIKE